MGKSNTPPADYTTTILPKYDMNLEAGLLSCILNNPEVYGRVSGLLDEDIFFDEQHKQIYKCIDETAAVKGDGLTYLDIILHSANQQKDQSDKAALGIRIGELYQSNITPSNGNLIYCINILAYLKGERLTLSLYQELQSGSITMDEYWAKVEQIKEECKKSADGEFADMLTPPDANSIDKLFEGVQEAYKTKYIFKKGSIEYNLMIPSGAITFISAPTSHGKSTMLRQLALDMAEEENNKAVSGAEFGDILYFTYEEDEADVTAQVMNTYIDLDFTNANKDFTHGNLSSLKEYLRNGDCIFIKKDCKNAVAEKATQFKQDFLCSGRLKFFYKDFDCDTLVRAMKYICSQIRVRAVFIDYIQLLYLDPKKSNRLSRTEELKQICNKLKDFAITTKLPIICAAQLNREGAKSPLDMRPQNMSESSDIEKIANVIVCMWNSDHKPDASVNWFDTSKNKDKRISELADRGFVIGDHDNTTIYAVLAKNRGGILGGDAVFGFNGNTGRVTPEATKATKVTNNQSNGNFL